VSEQQPAGERPEAAPSPQQPDSPYPRTFVARLSARYRVGGVVTPIFTTIVAFLAGGIVVGATGHNPLSTYRAIFNGTGLNWFFPWVLGGDRATAATNLQQTLILTTTLILTGLAVAFAFRCGMFNIGGQGQYFVGSYVAIFVGSSWAGLAGPAHIFLAVTFAALAGAAYGGIAGFLKATTGAHEVISTIMLNWIAIWVGNYFFGLAGPFQGPDQFNPISSTVADSAKLPVFWGDPQLQGLHVGIFIALGMLVVFWIVLNRTTLGYEVKAVGFNPDAAEYGGISVKKNYFLAMAISGGFAGLAGAMDILGWEFNISTPQILFSNIGFIGIAVALLGRNTAVGTLFGALLFGALYVGTSTRQLDASVFDPQLASNLTLIIQGLVVLFVGADLLIIGFWEKIQKGAKAMARKAPA
jgi:simple sugar transport system permease protein